MTDEETITERIETITNHQAELSAARNTTVKALDIVHKVLVEQASLNDATAVRLKFLETGRSETGLFFLIFAGVFVGNIVSGWLT